MKIFFLLETEECEICHIFDNPLGQGCEYFARFPLQREIHRHIIDGNSQSIWFASLSLFIIRIIFRHISVTYSHKKELCHCWIKLVTSLKESLVQKSNVCAMFGLVQFLQLRLQPFEMLSVSIGRGKMSPSRLCLFKLINQLQELAIHNLKKKSKFSFFKIVELIKILTELFLVFSDIVEFQEGCLNDERKESGTNILLETWPLSIQIPDLWKIPPSTLKLLWRSCSAWYLR